MNYSQRLLTTAGVGAACAFGALLAVKTGQTPAFARAMGAPEDNAKIATIDVLEVAERLFMSDRYLPARETLLKEKQGQIESLQASLQDLGQKIQAAGQSPDSEAMRQQYQQQAQAFNQARDLANNDLNSLSTQQFSEAYRLVIDASGTIAKNQGYGYVFATRRGPVEFRSKELQGALQEVLARPVLTSPDGVDITSAVLKELKLDESKPAAASSPAPEAEKKPEDANKK
jgi:Skp family chaperone for outer membrane proteins